MPGTTAFDGEQEELLLREVFQFLPTQVGGGKIRFRFQHAAHCGIPVVHRVRDEVLAERFDWGKQQDIFALAVRVSRLPQRIDLPMLPAYGGCKSWIELAEDLATAAAQPVLAEADFQVKLKQFESALVAR